MEKHTLLFSQYFSEFPDLDVKTREWIARCIGGALSIEKNNDDEMVFLKSILGEDKIIWKILENKLETISPSTKSAINVPQDLAETIFIYILRIYMRDHNLKSEELHYINDIGKILGIETSRKRQLLKKTIFLTKEEFFHQLIEKLGTKERYWLAIMSLKLIYADGEVHSKELSYFNHIKTLLADSKETLKSVKEGFTTVPIEGFDRLQLNENTLDMIMKYLLGIIMSDQDCSEKELTLIYEISQTVKYDKKKIEKMIDLVKLDFRFLFA